MPYITEHLRTALDEYRVAQESGELNYLLTMTCLKYLEDNGMSYSTLNDITGALENCKLEFYRRMTAPYEDTKIFTNGDVFP